MKTIKGNQTRGGKRPGAGRPKGAATRKTREIADKAAEEGLMPLEYMLRVLRDEKQTAENRAWAAEKAAPYCHAKLAAVDMKHSGQIDSNVTFETVYEGN
jgi:hypothetical protein